jgi:hypothetical protein
VRRLIRVAYGYLGPVRRGQWGSVGEKAANSAAFGDRGRMQGPARREAAESMVGDVLRVLSDFFCCTVRRRSYLQRRGAFCRLAVAGEKRA